MFNSLVIFSVEEFFENSIGFSTLILKFTPLCLSIVIGTTLQLNFFINCAGSLW